MAVSVCQKYGDVRHLPALNIRHRRAEHVRINL